MYYKDKGIVLKSDELKDADKLVTLFLYENGKNRIVFKGVSKPKSKKVASAELGSYIEVFFYKKSKNAPSYASEIKIIKSFSKIRENPVKFLYLNYILELFLNFSLEEKKDIKLFNFLLNSLIALQRADIKSIESIVRYIEYRLIQLNGILPDFSKCNKCNKKINQDAIIDFKESHILCKNCYTFVGNKHTCSLHLKYNVLKYIDILSKSSFKNINFNIPATINKEIKVIFYNLIVNYLSKELKSYKIIYKMLQEDDAKRTTESCAPSPFTFS